MRTPWSEQDWKRVGLYGVGASGLAAIRLLRRLRIAVVAVDDDAARLERARAEGAEIGSPDLDVSTIQGLVLSPGVPREQALVQRVLDAGLPVIAEIELASAYVRSHLIAVTGSNGKSTVCALCGSMLVSAGFDAKICGNFGPPLSDMAFASPALRLVVELSSFQLEGVSSFSAEAAALLNISPDHLDRHGSLEAYAQAKARILERQSPEAVAVLNADDEQVLEVSRGIGSGRRWLFSLHGRVPVGCYLQGESVVEVEGESEELLFERSDVPMPGEHNLANAMAAGLLARSQGVARQSLRRSLRRFEGLPHRMRKIAHARGADWYDDSKGTNIDATLKSLASFPGTPVRLILGGRHKGGDFSRLQSAVRDSVVKIYLIGEAAGEIEARLGGTVDAERCGTLAAAVEAIAREARPDEVVLLSPACASFDQFANFEERGRAFQQLVRECTGGRRG